ncbi:oligopeptide/dipeptide ABC transporter ATP-binding protein, partial [Vibrio cholerae]
PTLDAHADRLVQIDGSMPRLNAIPPGCAFNPRCGQRLPRCERDRPELMPAGTSQAACWLHDDAPTPRPPSGLAAPQGGAFALGRPGGKRNTKESA